MDSLSWPLSVPVLSDGVVTLRAATPADVAPMHEMTQDPDMQRWTAVPVPNTLEMSEAFALQIGAEAWDQGTARMWVVEHARRRSQPAAAEQVGRAVGTRGGGAAALRGAQRE